MPTPLVVGLGAACHLAGQEMEFDHDHVSRLSEMLVQVGWRILAWLTSPQGLTSQLPSVFRNGGDNVYEGCVNLSFHCVEVTPVLLTS